MSRYALSSSHICFLKVFFSRASFGLLLVHLKTLIVISNDILPTYLLYLFYID
jgi:hypothetical protein